VIINFTFLWALILGSAVFFYVLLDGFDLGVGILYGFISDKAERDSVMNSIAPIWDGNETWLVFGGLGLLAAFPLAFSIIIPAVYFPILTMLLSLIFRGVAFEFRYRNSDNMTVWDWAFCIGSMIATFSQGLILGAIIQGISVKNHQFYGTSFDFFTPFSFFTGIALIFGYGLLGAGWLILKTECKLQETARYYGRWCFIIVLAAIIIVSVWTPLMDVRIEQRWFSVPNIIYLSLIPIVTTIVALFEWRALNNNSEGSVFIGAMGLFFLSYIGIVISFYPMIVPPHVTLFEAAASLDAQVFLLMGTLFLLPIILMYTGWSYWVFRGKVRADTGYHL